MLRHHTEAVSMTLLCLDDTSEVYERFSANRATYPVHTAPAALRKKKRRDALQRLIAFDPDAWETILELTAHYDRLSHSSALSLAYNILIGSDTVLILGAEFDPGKAEAYRKEIVRCATAAEACAHLIAVVVHMVYPESRAT
jgi:hypothetical protein